MTSMLRIVGWCAGAAIILWTAVQFVPVISWTWLSDYGPQITVAIMIALILLTAAALVRWRSLHWAPALLAVTWLVPYLTGFPSLSTSVRTLTDAWSWVLPGLVVLTVLGSQGGHATRRSAAALAIGGSLLAVAVRTLLVDPFSDVDCWRVCRHNPLVITPSPPAAGQLYVVSMLLIAAGLVEAMRRQWSRTRLDRSAEMAAAGCVVGLLLVTFTGVPPGTTWLSGVLAVIDLGALGMSGSLMLREARDRQLRRRLTEMAIELADAPRPGEFGPALAARLGDDGLSVRYWAPDRDQFIDSEGLPCPDPRDVAPDRCTPVTRGERPLAVIVNSQPADPHRIGEALGPAMRLSLENEQLRAVALAELRELEASRQRILERAGQERRRLERNLHDGAQQRVVSLVLLLKMLSAHTPDTSRPRVEAASARAGQLLEELRRIARGIHPAVVADAGLTGALADLAASSAVLPVTVRGEPAVGLSQAAQTTAYELVSAALADAEAGSASAFDIRSQPAGSAVVLEVDHDATDSPARALDGLVPFVEALSGRLRVDGRPGSWRIRVELPCAS